MMLGAIGFFSMPAIREMRRSKAIENEINNLKSEAEKINTDNGFLRNQIEYLQSDHYKERLAKDKLNFRNPGEQVVVVQPISGENKELRAEGNSGNFENEARKEEIEEPNFKKWMEYFLK